MTASTAPYIDVPNPDKPLHFSSENQPECPFYSDFHALILVRVAKTKKYWLHVKLTKQISTRRVEMTWEITRIARCGGLSLLNPKQRRYVRESLRVMDNHGGKIFGHRCLTNAPLVSLMDFVHRDGRIAASSGTVDTFPHAWCEIDKKPFEVTHPLVDCTEREARRLTLSNLPHGYKAEFSYEWTEENFGRIFAELVYMTHPFNGNLSPEAAAILLKAVGCKLGVSFRQKDMARFAGSARKVRLESDRIFKEGCRANETIREFQERWAKEVDHQLCASFRAWSLAL